MRTTRPLALASLAVLLALPGVASANCYSIYDTANRLAFQSTVAPVDLSGRISQAMRARFPGGFLVMIPDDSECREFRTGSTTSPRFDVGTPGAETRSEQMLQAPILSGAPQPMSSLPTRETAARSGNNLNIRRP